jgi:hypothetical protein
VCVCVFSMEMRATSDSKNWASAFVCTEHG